VALRNYVLAHDDDSSRRNPNVLTVDLTHSNLRQRHAEIRFDAGTATFGDVAATVYRKTGTPPADQYLQAFVDDRLVFEGSVASDDVFEKTTLLSIGFRPLGRQKQRIYCTDLNPHSSSSNGQYEDTSLVKKFELTDEQYDALPKSVRRCKKEELLQEQQKLQQQLEEQYDKESVGHCLAGRRCEVRPGGRRGRVAWIGRLDRPSGNADSKDEGEDGRGNNKKKKASESKSLPPPGWWVGIELDEPVGQNDGDFGGCKYFEVDTPKTGCFARGPNVSVASADDENQYPVRDLFDEDDDDSDDDDDDDEL